MLLPKKNSYKEFDNEKKFLQSSIDGNESELSEWREWRARTKNVVTFVWSMFDLRKKRSCMPHGFSALFRLELTQVLVTKEIRFCDGVISAESVRDHKPI